MYKTAETGLETRARSARVSKVSKVLCIPVASLSYHDDAIYQLFPSYVTLKHCITLHSKYSIIDVRYRLGLYFC